LADQGARNVIDLSSDYGDEDFDDDTLMELDATLGAVQDTKPCPAPEPAPLETPKRAPPDANGFDDEFGDMDDDLFEAAEDLITEIESKPTTQQPQHGGARGGLVDDDNAEDDAEDVYGDDFGGDFDFEAVELAATQSARQPPVAAAAATATRSAGTASSLSHVRSRT
jgi:DNA replication ATP-dependent helicase Dna2